MTFMFGVSLGPSRSNRVMFWGSCSLNPSTPVMLCAPEHMATSSLRRTNETSYLVCYINTFIVRNEWGALAIHWWAWQFSSCITFFYNNSNCLCYELSCGCVSWVLNLTSIIRFLTWLDFFQVVSTVCRAMSGDSVCAHKDGANEHWDQNWHWKMTYVRQQDRLSPLSHWGIIAYSPYFSKIYKVSFFFVLWLPPTLNIMH